MILLATPKVQPWIQGFTYPIALSSNNNRATVLARASSTSSNNNSSTHSNPEASSSNMAMSRSDLESCQWLRPSVEPDSDHHYPHPSSDASSYNGVLSHQASPKHSSLLINAIPSLRTEDGLLQQPSWIEGSEMAIERAIFDFRFLSLLAVAGSLAGSFLCFLKGCIFITESYAYFYSMCVTGVHTGKMILRLVEAVDVYLTGTVMLIFGMGLYGLFISNIPSNLPPHEDRALKNSSLFGMFLLHERPKWMRIGSLDELKTKLGHVVVMILLVKMFERSKALTIATSVDLLSYSISIFLTSAALLVLHKLHH